MSDLIDRDAIEPFYESGTDPNDTYADMTFIRAEHIENAPAVNRWISVEDAMPDPEQCKEVLVYSKTLGQMILHVDYMKRPGLHVTHWRYLLPDPPEKE